MSTKLAKIDGVDYIFVSNEGRTICEPVDLGKFDAYIAGIKAQGPAAVEATLAAVEEFARSGQMFEMSEQRKDVLRRERAAEIAAELR